MVVLRKALARRFASFLRQTAASPPAGRPFPFRRFPLLQKRPFFQPALPPDRTAKLLSDDRLAERIRELNPGRVCLDGILPLAEDEVGEGEQKRVTVEETRKAARALQVAAARARLEATGKSCVPYAEFVKACCETSNKEQGLEIARSLDESGIVVAIGSVVFLKPEEVVRAIENMIPLWLRLQNGLNADELVKMEEKKAEIDKIAAAQARKELWCGLGFMMAQTAVLMRMTFCELSWNVMEPICFYLTSTYFLAGYTFFLRTSKEPTFQNLFESRFAAKQKRLMEEHNFDLNRFNELSQAHQHPLQPPPYHGNCDRNIPSFAGSSD